VLTNYVDMVLWRWTS